MTISEPRQTSSEDEAILGVVRDLCSQLKVKFLPSGVSWMGNLGFTYNLPSDQTGYVTKGPRRSFVVLPAALKGRLESAEWKCLLASSILFQFTPEFRRVYLFRYGLMLFAIVGSIALIGASFVFRDILGFLLSLVLFILAWFIGPRIYRFYTLRRVRLRADIETTRILGKDQFVKVLEKIDSMHIIDLEERKTWKPSIWSRRVYVWPTITERLQNLRSV